MCIGLWEVFGTAVSRDASRGQDGLYEPGLCAQDVHPETVAKKEDAYLPTDT